ncbi:MAG: hypothetical protein E7172_05745 [Firmicutes bacterium]|nr:hypothetical protein [Bacillota bacterium]
MARTKKELTPEELKLKEEQKELEKQKKQEEREYKIKNCIIPAECHLSDTDIIKFVNMSKDLKCAQGELLKLAVQALLNDKIAFNVNTTTTLTLK